MDCRWICRQKKWTVFWYVQKAVKRKGKNPISIKHCCFIVCQFLNAFWQFERTERNHGQYEEYDWPGRRGESISKQDLERHWVCGSGVKRRGWQQFHKAAGSRLVQYLRDNVVQEIRRDGATAGPVLLLQQKASNRTIVTWGVAVSMQTVLKAGIQGGGRKLPKQHKNDRIDEFRPIERFRESLQ
jgi:hypothetical protein